jgi:hypothetical protein
MEFMMLASMNPDSGFSAGPGWIDWDAAGPSSAVVAENDYVGDGTIDPSVLGGVGCSGASLGGASPDKALFRSETNADYISPRRSPLFVRARGKDKYLDDVDMEDEGDVMGLLFDDPTDGDFVSRLPPVRGPDGKGKDEDKATVAGADTMQIGFDIGARAGGTRIRRKSWRKALADGDDDDKTDHCEDTDAGADGAVVRRHSPNMSSNPSSSLDATYCHHCRRNTFKPKMRCTHIRESTGEQCRKLFCDLCVERRYVPAPP